MHITSVLRISVLFSLLVSFLTIFLSLLLTSSNAYSEKTIAYECGFEPFSDARDKFSVNFYVTAIIFLIFDIELAYLIPLAISYGYVGVAIVPSALIFIILLALGYVFEIVKH